MTKLCYFFNTVEPDSKYALCHYADTARLLIDWVDTNDSTNQKYADELAKRWNQGEDIIIVEEDKEIHADVLPSFLACKELICVYQYVHWQCQLGQVIAAYGTGCIKYSARIQELIAVEDFRGDQFYGIDGRLLRVYEDMTSKPFHVHEGMVQHHHKGRTE